MILPERVVLAGDKIMVVIKTRPKPRCIPAFLWKRLVRLVVLNQTVNGSITVVRD